jgi:hypothetical protein
MEAWGFLLRWQLITRLDPPIPDDLIGPAELAIDLVRAGSADRTVDLPGGQAVSAGDLVEALELDRLVD